MKTVHEYRGVSFTIPKIQKDGDGGKIYHPTLLRIKNLLDMVVVLRQAPPPEFDMSCYAVIDDYDSDLDLSTYIHHSVQWGGNLAYPAAVTKMREEKNVCGTSCCALGTAAWHGIGKITRGMIWEEYSNKNYGLIYDTEIWTFLFHGEWASVDNTPEGAAARILKLVIEGPENILGQTGLTFEREGMRGMSWDNLLDNAYREDDIETIKCFYGDYLTKEVK
jgi:hypothetical protein